MPTRMPPLPGRWFATAKWKSLELTRLSHCAGATARSAAELAGDFRRYLSDQPITARPASATYQLQKFARRHKALVAGTAVVFLVLAAGVVASTWEAVRARTAQRAADSEAATAQAINNFLRNDLLAQASASNQSGPSTKPDPDLKVRTALDRSREPD